MRMQKILTLSLMLLLVAVICAAGGCKKQSKYAGQDFSADLTTLDGKTFSIPQDTKGKVVVVDFWAAWCPPCRKLVPHMKQIHEKYKDKDVVIVGISLDADKAKLQKFIADEKMNWVQTCSWKKWEDPTVQKYGIDGIPAVWVIGKDGKVVSTDAADATSEIIDKALKQ
ncbi:MAG: TlpA family protein disulfide reductase [Phycisphaerae bacterium]|nr:TlpA family protein disulfide reductase [Phycisphaerae bacterium]